MKKTKSLFIVSSGRSGTQMLEKVFNSYDSVEMNHEYLCNYVQPLAVKFYLGLIDKNTVKNKLEELHGASIYYSEKSLWGDSSNKLSWLIGPLNELFPDAKFIHLIRDGRKVVNSFYNKLGNECYDDKSTSILQSWVEKPNKILEPPPEKKYWWNVVKKESPFYKKFNKYNQFQKICYHWNEINKVIDRDLINIDKKRKLVLRLEDLVTDEETLKTMVKFVGLEYKSELFEMLKTPHNVNIPINFSFTKIEKKQFYNIAEDLMKKYGYNKNCDYKVDYHRDKLIN